MAIALVCTLSSFTNENLIRDNEKTTEELLIGSWHKSTNEDGIKLALYWHFNEDKTEQIISISSVNEEISTTNCGTWEIEGDIIKTVNLSTKEKVYNEWKILKLDKDSLIIEFYDKQPKRFVESLKRINK